MTDAIICCLSLITANFLYAWINGGDYTDAVHTSHNQLLAVMTYYFIWVRPEIKQLKERFNG